MPNAAQVAATFARIVREELSAELTAIVAENRTRRAAGDLCCATHDHCDANELMMAAFEEHGVVDIEVIFNELSAVWNEAWKLAAEADFGPLAGLTTEQRRALWSDFHGASDSPCDYVWNFDAEPVGTFGTRSIRWCAARNTWLFSA